MVRLAEMAVERGDVTLATFGLGSCVAIMLSDVGTQVGGMAHILLPAASLARGEGRAARFPQTATPELLRRMRALGADHGRIVAKLVGGASMFRSLLEPGTVSMGERNVAACRAALREAGIPIVSEITGGVRGRSAWLDAATGRVLVKSVGESDVHI